MGRKRKRSDYCCEATVCEFVRGKLEEFWDQFQYDMFVREDSHHQFLGGVIAFLRQDHVYIPDGCWVARKLGIAHAAWWEVDIGILDMRNNCNYSFKPWLRFYVCEGQLACVRSEIHQFNFKHGLPLDNSAAHTLSKHLHNLTLIPTPLLSLISSYILIMFP